LREITESKFLSAEEAWTKVSQALWSVTSYEKAEAKFKALPEECQQTLGSASALYAYTQGEWKESVNKSLFIKSYNPTVERMKTESRMSHVLRTALGTAERKGIEERNQT
jgi:hypothetical protein